MIEIALLLVGNSWEFTGPVQRILAVTVQNPWLDPWESELYWMVPTAAAVLCIPFFFMSVWVENRVARRYFAEDERPSVLRWTWKANLLSYGLVVLWPLTALFVGIYEH